VGLVERRQVGHGFPRDLEGRPVAGRQVPPLAGDPVADGDAVGGDPQVDVDVTRRLGVGERRRRRDCTVVALARLATDHLVGLGDGFGVSERHVAAIAPRAAVEFEHERTHREIRILDHGRAVASDRERRPVGRELGDDPVVGAR
jgi:hypothetical protein